MSRKGGSNMGRINVEVELANQEDLVRARDGTIPSESVRRIRAAAVVDTGASFLVIPGKIARHLGVPSAGKATVRYADQRRQQRTVVEMVRLELLGRHGVFRAIVERRREDVLLGAIVLEDLDLLVDCRIQSLSPRDPKQIVAEIEYQRIGSG
jgi:predicted aspartyl protease